MKLLIRITNRCNLECIHCLSNSKKGYYHKNYEIKYILNRLDDLINESDHFDDIIFSGGEAFLEKEKMIEVISYLVNRNITTREISIITNGVDIKNNINFINEKILPFNIPVDLRISNTMFHKVERKSDIHDLDIASYLSSDLLTITIIGDDIGNNYLYYQGRAIENKDIIEKEYKLLVQDDGERLSWYTDEYNVQLGD